MQTHFIVVDLETTGLDPKRDKIIEIGAVKVVDDKIVRTYETFVNPGRKLSEKVKEITGITDEDLAGAPFIQDVLHDFLEFADEDCILGHSVMFDYSFLKRAAVNLGAVFEKNGIDTLRIARRFLPELESRSLPALCKHYEIPHKAHRALDDAVATYELYLKLKEQFYLKDGETFQPKKLNYQVKKEAPVKKSQLEQIHKLLAFHGLLPTYTNKESEEYVDFEQLTRNEASRFMDYIILHYGKCH